MRMMNSNDFESPDREGHEYELNSPLFFHEGMLFRGTLEKDWFEIEKQVMKYGRDEAQKSWNHLHMILRCKDINTQRQWAFELIDRYRERATEICPNYFLIGEIRDDEFGIEVTFWIVARDRKS